MRAGIWTAVLAVGVATGATADAQIVKGDQVAENTKRLMSSIGWVTSRATLAKKAKASGKMQFWLQVVGELDGGL